MIKILIIVFSLFSNAVFASDEKPERYFVDQPDVTDEPQVHFIYLLNKDSEDREWDINGKMEKELLEANEKMLEMTKGNQKFRYDLREDGKMDISFVRFDKHENIHEQSQNNGVYIFLLILYLVFLPASI